jgi:hypothetical protein
MPRDNTDAVLFDVTREQLAAAFRLAQQVRAVLTVAYLTRDQLTAVERQVEGLRQVLDELDGGIDMQRRRHGLRG